MDNSSQRLHTVFFYGLYMDPTILEQKGVVPRQPCLASVENYELRIGNKATLLRSPGKLCHGMVYSLTQEEIHALYWGSGLEEYRTEAVLVKVGGKVSAALCCNLLHPPEDDESNPVYASKLKHTMQKLGVPVLF